MKFPQTNIAKLSRQVILFITKYTVMIVIFSFVVTKGIFNIILSQAGNQTKANTPVNISDQSKIVPKKTTKPMHELYKGINKQINNFEKWKDDKTPWLNMGGPKRDKS